MTFWKPHFPLPKGSHNYENQDESQKLQRQSRSLTSICTYKAYSRFKQSFKNINDVIRFVFSRPRCQQGKCVAPDSCKCHTGFGGRDCSKCEMVMMMMVVMMMIVMSIGLWGKGMMILHAIACNTPSSYIKYISSVPCWPLGTLVRSSVPLLQRSQLWPCDWCLLMCSWWLSYLILSSILSSTSLPSSRSVVVWSPVAQNWVGGKSKFGVSLWGIATLLAHWAIWTYHWWWW